MRPGRPLVWIIDDSATQAAIAERTLGDAYRYERFTSGESAIERLASSPPSARPDLILLDWVMPGLSGDEVCRYLRTLPDGGDLAIIIVTASRDETAGIVSSLASGANDYLTKPFTAAELHARVGSLLRASALAWEARRERQRLAAMNDLAKAVLGARGDVQVVLDSIAAWFSEHLVADCRLTLTTVQQLTRTATSGGGGGASPPTITRRVELADLGWCSVALTREPGAPPFDASDALEMDTALDYSGLAIESAIRAENDRATARFLQEMLGIVSHDLRTPLTAFGLGLDLLASETLTPQDRAVLRARLGRSAKRMSGIVEQLLDVTRTRIGTGIRVARAPVKLRDLVERVVEELRMAKGNTTLFEVEGDDVEGDWDGARLEQVFANLAGNAAQYGRSGAPIRIAVTATALEARVSVHNQNRDGVPIPAAKLATLFDPFTRGTSGANLEGLGLGLYISSEITKAHRGTITVDSDPDGTTFRVTLPLSG